MQLAHQTEIAISPKKGPGLLILKRFHPQLVVYLNIARVLQRPQAWPPTACQHKIYKTHSCS